MKFKRNNELEYGVRPIHIAPMIDCFFLLLIFFMFASSFTFQSSIKVKLPKVVTSDMIQDKNVIVTITGENVIYLNGTVVTLKELSRKLQESNYKARPLLIRSDRRASVGRVVDVWDLCRNLGIERIHIATNQDL